MLTGFTNAGLCQGFRFELSSRPLFGLLQVVRFFCFVTGSAGLKVGKLVFEFEVFDRM